MTKAGLRIITTRVESSGLPSDLWAGKVLLSPFQKLKEPQNYRITKVIELVTKVVGSDLHAQGSVRYSMVLRTPKHLVSATLPVPAIPCT